jgi:hypothetical protein
LARNTLFRRYAWRTSEAQSFHALVILCPWSYLRVVSR